MLKSAAHENPSAMVLHISEILMQHLEGAQAPDDTTWLALRIRERRSSEAP